MDVKFTFDFTRNEINKIVPTSFALENDETEVLLLHFGFDTETNQSLKGVSFNYKAFVNGAEIQTNKWPKLQRYVSTDLKYIFVDAVKVQPSFSLVIKVQAEKDGVRLEDSISFVVLGSLKRLTHLQFLRKFTHAEIASFEVLLTKAKNMSDDLTDDQRGQLLLLEREFNAAKSIKLDDPDTILFVNNLAEAGVLAPERVAEVLDPSIYPAHLMEQD